MKKLLLIAILIVPMFTLKTAEEKQKVEQENKIKNHNC